MDMPKPSAPETELSYPLRSAARLTGLSPHVLRAWEMRYGVVDPLRTLGRARRYRRALAGQAGSPAKTRVTRLLRLPSLRILATTTGPTSRVLRTCVPPQA